MIIFLFFSSIEHSQSYDEKREFVNVPSVVELHPHQNP